MLWMMKKKGKPKQSGEIGLKSTKVASDHLVIITSGSATSVIPPNTP